MNLDLAVYLIRELVEDYYILPFMGSYNTIQKRDIYTNNIKGYELMENQEWQERKH